MEKSINLKKIQNLEKKMSQGNICENVYL